MKKLYFVILAVALVTVPAAALTWTVFADNSAGRISTPSSISKTINSVSSTLGLASPAAATAHHVDLSKAQTSKNAEGQTIVAMDAKGDLPGSFTLTLNLSPDGTRITGGFWALVVSHTKFTPMAQGQGDGDGYNEVLEQIGTLSGAVSGGSMTTDASGNISALNGVDLAVDQGSVEFNGTTQGSGSAQESNLQDPGNSAGSLSLSF